jgi:hypothetical protein
VTKHARLGRPAEAEKPCAEHLLADRPEGSQSPGPARIRQLGRARRSLRRDWAGDVVALLAGNARRPRAGETRDDCGHALPCPRRTTLSPVSRRSRRGQGKWPVRSISSESRLSGRYAKPATFTWALAPIWRRIPLLSGAIGYRSTGGARYPASQPTRSDVFSCECRTDASLQL